MAQFTAEHFNFVFFLAVCKKPILTNEETKCTNGNNVGSRCSYKCPDQMQLVGTAIRQCVRFGNSAQWNSNPPKCQPACDQIQLLNGHAECTNQNFLNSKCIPKCNLNYKLSGSREHICQITLSGADWYKAGVESYCNPICQPIEKLENGKITCSSNNDFGSVCLLDCFDRV